MMGSLGHNTHVDVNVIVEQVLWGELQSLVDSGVLWGLSVLIISIVADVGGTGRDPEGDSMSTGSTLGIGDGLLMADRCWSNCLIHGREVLADD